MTIRNYEDRDFEQVLCLAKKHGLKLPSEGHMLVAEDKNNEIRNIIVIRQVYMIEPMIAENPIIGWKLWKKALKFARENNMNILRIFVKDPQKKGLFQKLGFRLVFNNHKIMEKEI